MKTSRTFLFQYLLLVGLFSILQTTIFAQCPNQISNPVLSLTTLQFHVEMCAEPYPEQVVVNALGSICYYDYNTCATNPPFTEGAAYDYNSALSSGLECPILIGATTGNIVLSWDCYECTYDPDTGMLLQSNDSDCNGTCLGQATVSLPCDDGNPCTINDVEIVLESDNNVICSPCSGTLQTCATVGATTTQPCDDGNPGTTNDVETILNCDGSVCVPCQGEGDVVTCPLQISNPVFSLSTLQFHQEMCTGPYPDELVVTALGSACYYTFNSCTTNPPFTEGVAYDYDMNQSSGLECPILIGAATGDIVIGWDCYECTYDPDEGNLIASDNSGCDFSSLALELLHFSTQVKKEDILLKWQIQDEQQILKNFEIQRTQKINANNWKTVGIVSPQPNNSTTTFYSFLDTDAPNGTIYYRLKQIELDNRTTFSNVITAKKHSQTMSKVEVYPNPVNKGNAIFVRSEQLGKSNTLQLFHTNGQLMAATSISDLHLDENTVSWNLPALPTGIYLLALKGSSTPFYQKLFIK